jgi:Zn-dependent metalloprotease
MSLGLQSIAWAGSDPFVSIPFARAGSGIDGLRDAYQALRSDPTISRLVGRGEHALSLFQRISANEVESTKFQAYFKGLEVVGSMAVFHRGRFRTQVSNWLAKFDLDVRPSLGAELALSLARAAVDADQAGLTLERAPELKVLPGEQDPAAAKLVYWVRFAGQPGAPGFEVVVDAHAGNLIAVVSDHVSIAPVQVYETNDECQRVHPLTGAPISLNFKACSQTVVAGRVSEDADESARRAATNSTQVLKYFLSRHRRDSYDGRGSEVVSIVHVGKNFDNAFWDGSRKIMAYGDGDGQETGDFTQALDVAGHEMTHGVVSQTAKLLNFGESGALNEAFADFFGKMIANDGDWSMGRRLYLDQAKAKGFRNLADPHAVTVTYRDANGERVTRAYPEHMNERLVATGACDPRTNDNCWVHVNATIPGHASYLVVQAIGKENAEKLYYTALTQYLNSRANFRTMAEAVKQASSMLYDAATTERVRGAFEQVGL